MLVFYAKTIKNFIIKKYLKSLKATDLTNKFLENIENVYFSNSNFKPFQVGNFYF